MEKKWMNSDKFPTATFKRKHHQFRSKATLTTEGTYTANIKGILPCMVLPKKLKPLLRLM